MILFPDGNNYLYLHMKNLYWDNPSKEKDKNTFSRHFTTYTSPFPYDHYSRSLRILQ